jgi:hypothetical protein
MQVNNVMRIAWFEQVCGNISLCTSTTDGKLTGIIYHCCKPNQKSALIICVEEVSKLIDRAPPKKWLSAASKLYAYGEACTIIYQIHNQINSWEN